MTYDIANPHFSAHQHQQIALPNLSSLIKIIKASETTLLLLTHFHGYVINDFFNNF